MNAGDQLIAKGRIEGLRAAILTAASARGAALSDTGRTRISSCTDAAVLTRCLACAVTASSEAEVFDGPSAAD